VETQKRVLHTLKGNTSMIGFTAVAQLAHQLEDVLLEEAASLSAETLSPLRERWQSLEESLRTFLGDKGREVTELSSHEVERVIEMVRSGAPAAGVLDRMEAWCLEPTERSLRRLGNYAVAQTRRLGKGDLILQIQSNGISLSPKRWAGFWSDLIHVIRNTVDHGLETPSERRAAGKSEVGRLRLSTRIQRDHQLIIEIDDDGRGIDWSAIETVAIQKGLPHATREDLTAAMFSSGVSTRTEVTSMSGRGVGLAAVMQQVRDLGGSVSIETEATKGCCFRFTFTLAEIGPRFGIDVNPDATPLSAVA
jgi:two-component system chemotaxis sensor kinase CheA